MLNFRPQLKAGLDASLELQCRENKRIRASFEAGFEAGLEGLKAVEIGAKQCDRKT